MATREKKTAIPADCMPMCRSCAFWESDQEIDGGFCHRRPPAVFMIDGEPASMFPVTNDRDWCGEFARMTN